MRYVALLRGINVGGNRKVPMAELKAAFQDAGMDAVRTYINSGNVIFSTAEGDRAELATSLETAIRERFGFEIAVLLRDINEMRELVGTLPAEWSNNDHMKCDVVFLWPEVDDPSIIEDLGPRPGIEDAIYHPGHVVWRIDRTNASRNRLTRMVGTPLYQQVTVRNCNTTRKLLALMEE